MNSMKKQGLFTCSLLGCLLGFDLASFTAAAQTTEPNEWAWMGGSNGLSQQGPPAGVFGTLGSFAAGNFPPVHSGPAIWNDGKGHVWLFSGASLSPFEFVYPNDLWEFDIATNQWAWMGGTGTVPQSSQGISGTYGTLGTPAPGNIPGGREGAATWIDKSGNLWLFGGYGQDGFGYLGYLDDWWKFDPSTGLWTWMGGSSGVSSCPITYGNLGVPNADNIPECRDYAASWTDSAGHFWMFGGTVFTSKNGTYDFGDMWELDPSTNQWAWVGGSDTVNNYGTYGTLGVPATGNIPGARSGPAYWTDSSGNFWLFGGIGYAAPVTTGALSGFENDLWMFNPTTKEWTWVNGSSVPGSTGQSGTLGTLAAGNLPESRASASGWVDSNGNIWIFGGFAETVSLDAYDSNDLWVFNPPSGQWAWMGGGSSSTLSNDYGVYGALGTPAAGNWPGPRENSGSWTDGNGDLWLFSGVGVANDLWEYTPAIKGTLPTVATPTFTPAPGTYPYPQFGQIVISDATDGANIYYTLDGTTPTTNSTPYNDAHQIFLDGSDEVVNAIATAYGSYQSAMGSATYHVTLDWSTTVTVTPAASSVAINAPLTVAVTVDASHVGVTPSGTVTLSSGSYTSAPANLSPAGATFNLPANSLVNGSNVLTVAYSGDSYYAPATGTATETVTAPQGITISGTDGYGRSRGDDWKHLHGDGQSYSGIHGQRCTDCGAYFQPGGSAVSANIELWLDDSSGRHWVDCWNGHAYGEYDSTDHRCGDDAKTSGKRVVCGRQRGVGIPFVRRKYAAAYGLVEIDWDARAAGDGDERRAGLRQRRLRLGRRRWRRWLYRYRGNHSWELYRYRYGDIRHNYSNGYGHGHRPMRGSSPPH
jgi:hypothetical protein